MRQNFPTQNDHRFDQLPVRAGDVTDDPTVPPNPLSVRFRDFLIDQRSHRPQFLVHHSPFLRFVLQRAASPTASFSFHRGRGYLFRQRKKNGKINPT
jgi:hypothetical protein